MRTLSILLTSATLALAATATLLATTPSSATSPSAYLVTNLVSDGAVPASVVDPGLKNPWGIAFDPLGPTWFADNGSNLSTLYIALGIKFPITVSIPSGENGPMNPTGIVYNPSLIEFMINKSLALGPAQFIFSGEGGTIAAWSQLSVGSVDMSAETMYDDGAGGAVYKGLALARNGFADCLYATDFHNAKIDVFDNTFKKVTHSGFHDPNLPEGYAPFGIQAINNLLYVTYAPQQGPQNHDQINGTGLGLVDVFTPAGVFVKRLVTGGPLNAPWGMAPAPAVFGQFSGALLVGNFGDGRINAFNPSTGQFLGSLSDANGRPIAIPNLWGLAFGNSLLAPATSLYFAAGINDEADGLYGTITLLH